MQVKLAIDSLAKIAAEITGWDWPARLGAFGAYAEIERALCAQARGACRPHVIEELSRYRWSIEALCGLSVGEVLPEWEHVKRMEGVADALRSEHCLGNLLDRQIQSKVLAGARS